MGDRGSRRNIAPGLLPPSAGLAGSGSLVAGAGGGGYVIDRGPALRRAGTEGVSKHHQQQQQQHHHQQQQQQQQSP
ncbi:hypothetical protein ACO22_06014 [Paracoccidioides brasiliensis]|uniref:Uncharacterized protein n=1 Tax=Paracoccidioides brasiliensis TaxID=121759 RepID=A0A1D2J8N9_PARBR|nr:hypothetical protein ACO22_06014 [Paracoccidioides brasiliensis]